MTATLLASFPSPPSGIAGHLGPFPIRWYAVFIIVGIIVALVIGDRRWVARGGEPGVVYDIALWAVPFGLVGGRLYHVMTDWQTYFGENGLGFFAAFKAWEGGLGIWGAVALGGVGAWIGCRRLGIPLPAFGDAIAPGIVLAQAIGRVGNYFNQELYGRATTLPWGVKIYERRDPSGVIDVHAVDGVSTGQVHAIVHPTFLYELIWNVLVFVLLIYADRWFRLGHGRLFALYVASYCVGRFCVELLRDDKATLIAGIRINSFTSTFVFIGAVVYIMLAPKGREDPATLVGEPPEPKEKPKVEKPEPERPREPVKAEDSALMEWTKELVSASATTGVVAGVAVAAEDDEAEQMEADIADAAEDAETAALVTTDGDEDAAEPEEAEAVEGEEPEAEAVSEELVEEEEPVEAEPVEAEAVEGEEPEAEAVSEELVEEEEPVEAKIVVPEETVEPVAARLPWWRSLRSRWRKLSPVDEAEAAQPEEVVEDVGEAKPVEARTAEGERSEGEAPAEEVAEESAEEAKPAEATEAEEPEAEAVSEVLVEEPEPEVAEVAAADEAEPVEEEAAAEQEAVEGAEPEAEAVSEVLVEEPGPEVAEVAAADEAEPVEEEAAAEQEAVEGAEPEAEALSEEVPVDEESLVEGEAEAAEGEAPEPEAEGEAPKGQVDEEQPVEGEAEAAEGAKPEGVVDQVPEPVDAETTGGEGPEVGPRAEEVADESGDAQAPEDEAQKWSEETVEQVGRTDVAPTEQVGVVGGARRRWRLPRFRGRPR